MTISQKLRPWRHPTDDKPTVLDVVVVDDQEVIRDAFAAVLSDEPTVNLAGSLSTGDEAVRWVRRFAPAVVVMDVKMPGLSGTEAASQIRADTPDIGIILLSAYHDGDDIRDFLKDGPHGKAYLLKQTLATKDELVRTIHDVAAGRTVLDPLMVEKLTAQRGIPENSPLRELSARELEVLALIAKAHTNTTIGEKLFIQPRTVEHHVNSILKKLRIAHQPEQHARVKATLSYLSAVGEGPAIPEQTW